MKLSKRRKLFLAVLAVGGGALAVDRVVLNSGVSGPASAAAAVALSDAGASVEAGEKGVPAAELDSVGKRLEQMRTAGGGETLTDAFAAVAGWFPAPDRKQVRVRGSREGVSAPASEKARLTALGRNSATVDGHIVSVGGQEVSGVRLISVDLKGRVAVIEENGVRSELRLGGGEMAGSVGPKKQ